MKKIFIQKIFFYPSTSFNNKKQKVLNFSGLLFYIDIGIP